ncbi:MAG: glycosyltransferase [Clostridiales bacterium]|nr:glycosyltransferase [Clostridiales bacterium]
MFSLVVPAYREGKSIRCNLLKMAAVLRDAGIDYEIVAVNDGSPDNTYDEIVKASEEDPSICPATYDVNRGKGGAIKEGIMKSSGDIIGFIDADLDIDPDHLPVFLEKMTSSGSDVVIGSKMHPESQLDYPAMRRFVSWGYYVILKVLFDMKTKDTQTGIKLYKGSLIKEIVPKLKVNGYAFDIEILALANSKGAVITEMPVRVGYTRDESFGRIRFKDIWKMFTDTIGIWWNLRIRKKY